MNEWMNECVRLVVIFDDNISYFSFYVLKEKVTSSIFDP